LFTDVEKIKNKYLCLIVLIFCIFYQPLFAADLNELNCTYRRFTVIEEDGKVAAIKPIPADPKPLWARNISHSIWDWSNGPDPNTPFFKPPIPFVLPPEEGSGEPFYSHNHLPSITWLTNGDLLAVWYSTQREQGTELTMLASRKRAGTNQWDLSSEFFKAQNRNMHGSSIFHDGKGTIYHFNGMGREGVEGWENLALLLRTSTDNGVTWTPARPVSSGAEYKRRNMSIPGMIRTQSGVFIQACDAVPGGNGGSALQISRDNGKTWYDPGLGKPAPDFKQGSIGQGTIAGIHAGVIDLADGRLLAFGRGDSINGRMPQSLSDDLGETWSYSASPFPPIGGGQRLVLKRLLEGPLVLISFTNLGQNDKRTRMEFKDADGNTFEGFGMYAALSFDEGQTWPVRKLLTPGKDDYNGGAWTGAFTASKTRAEHGGYLAVTQTPDGVIHLISSRLYYQFNLKWLLTPEGK
jgi:hypothetical protein